MHLKPLSSAATLAALLALTPSLARADRRYYGETYNAATAPPGGLDIEAWTTRTEAKSGSGEPSFWRHMLELETGITPRWDVALYNVLDQVDGQSLQYSQTKLETRYRLSDYGEWFVDPVLYLELKKEWTADKPFGIEGKLILAKDVGDLNLSLNGSYEIELIPDGGGQEHELEYAFGASYEVAPWVRLGGEAWGIWTRAADTGAWASEQLVGPALSLAYGRTWLVLAAGFGLTDESPEHQLRAIFALQL